MNNTNATTDALINQRLANGRFHILNLLGSGGMADVFRAWDQQESREVAVKFPKPHLSADANFAARFQREIKTMSRLRHPNIVQVLYVGSFNGQVYAVFPYLSGGSLKDRLNNHALSRGPLSADHLRWLVEIAGALDYLHQNNLLHRDVKPDNIFFDAQGKAFLGDFGIVRALDPGPQDGQPTLLTAANSVLGTVAYMPPEMIMAHTPYTGAIDQYSLAVTVYEALKGSRPFAGTPQQVMVQACQNIPVPLQQTRPDLPHGVSNVVQRGLAKTPAERFPSCTAFARAVMSSLTAPTAFSRDPIRPPHRDHYSAETMPSHSRTATVPTPPLLPTANPMPWRAIIIVSSAIVGLGLIVGILVLVLQRGDTADGPIGGHPKVAAPKRPHTGNRFVHFGKNNEMRAVLSNNNIANRRYFARVFDLNKSKSLTPTLGHTDWLYRASFSPDGTLVASAGRDSKARVWNAKTGKPETPWLMHAKQVNDICFHPDGGRVTTASDDGTARLWNAHNGIQVTPPLQHLGRVITSSFSPDGNLVLTASADGTARLWHNATGRAQGGVFRHRRNVMQAAFSTDGTMVATASSDQDARIWSVKTGKSLTRPLQHTGTVYFVEFSLDDKMLVSASLDKTARVWDVKSGKLLATVLHNERVYHAAFSPDGTMIATASKDRTARIWDAKTGRALTPPLVHFDVVGRVTFSPDGRNIITTCWDHTCWIWNVKTGKKIRSVFCTPN